MATQTLTPFGKEMRKLRIDKGLRLLDLADRLEVSVAYLSAIETGRKPIPDGFVVKVSRTMRLDAAEISTLRGAADRTRKTVTVERLPEEQREIVAAFARKLDKLPDNLVAELKRRLELKSSAGDVPFARKRRGIVVPPLKTTTIREFADQVRTAFADDNEIAFPIMDVLEFQMEKLFNGFALDVRSEDEMGDDEGRMLAGANTIILREDVYRAAWAKNGRARFTACHELGHFLMHRTVTMARMRSDDEEVYRDAEWQADVFAGTLLLSPRHLSRLKAPEDAASHCEMSLAAAQYMWDRYAKEGRFARQFNRDVRQLRISSYTGE